MYDLQTTVLDGLRRVQARQQPEPTFLEIYPTPRCNLSCRICVQDRIRARNPSELPDETLIGLVKEAIALGARICLIGGGGEPFCRRELVLALMELVKGHGLAGGLISNATLLKESDLKQMVVLGWDDVHFSIDGPEAETCDYLRGQGTFEKTVRALGWLNQYKRTYGKKEPALTFNFVLTRTNYRALPRYVRFAKEHQAVFISANNLIPHSAKLKRLTIPKSEQGKATAFIQEARRLAQDLKIANNLADLGYPMEAITGENSNTGGSAPANPVDGARLWNRLLAKLPFGKTNRRELSQAYCLQPWYHLVVQSDGRTGPCCIFQSKKTRLDARGARELWLGSRFAALRERMLTGRVPAVCLRCPESIRAEGKRLQERLVSSPGA